MTMPSFPGQAAAGDTPATPIKTQLPSISGLTDQLQAQLCQVHERQKLSRDTVGFIKKGKHDLFSDGHCFRGHFPPFTKSFEWNSSKLVLTKNDLIVYPLYLFSVWSQNLSAIQLKMVTELIPKCLGEYHERKLYWKFIKTGENWIFLLFSMGGRSIFKRNVKIVTKSDFSWRLEMSLNRMQNRT